MPRAKHLAVTVNEEIQEHFFFVYFFKVYIVNSLICLIICVVTLCGLLSWEEQKEWTQSTVQNFCI